MFYCKVKIAAYHIPLAAYRITHVRKWGLTSESVIRRPDPSSEKIENQRSSEAVYTWPILYPNRRPFFKIRTGSNLFRMTDGSVTLIFIDFPPIIAFF